MAVTLAATRGLAHLPRDARDTLFLLAVIAWTVLPHVSHLPVWCTGLAAVVLIWRARLAVVNAPLPGRWVVFAVLAIATAATLLTYKTILGKDPGVTMAVMLMALKTLELRARRDAFVVFFLGFFLVLTHFLYSQSPLVALAMLGSVWGLLTALVLAHMPVGKPPILRAGRLSLRTALLGAPIMVLLFVLFPRFGPLWGVPQDGNALTGLSNSLSFGSVADLAVDDRIAMRIRFLDAPPPQSDLYFRGPVLTRFDGTGWSPLNTDFPLPATAQNLNVDGPGIRHEVTLEPLKLPLLPLLDATPSLPPIEGLWTRRRDDLSWATIRPVRERLRFEARAHIAYRLGPPTLAGRALADALQLPDGVAPRTRAWATALGSQPALADAPASRKVAAVLAHIRTAGYTYTLAPGLYGERDPRAAIDEFWLDRREGFCEHFAATTVVVLRAMNIPARIVTGYQGTDAALVDGYHIVRQSQAHAWVEYWGNDAGWVRADPTGAVAPDRIFNSRALRPAPGLVAGAFDNVNPQLSAQLRALWETIDNRWNQWILNYSRGQQLDLLKDLGFEAPSWEDLAKLLVIALSGLSAIVAGWAWWDRRRQDPWARQSAALGALLATLGVAAPPHAPPRHLARAVRERFGAEGHTLAGLLTTREQQRYGRTPLDRPDPALLRAVRAEVRRLRRTAAGPAATAMPDPETR